MNKLGLLALLGALTVSTAPAFAQGQVNPKAKEKARWYNAPREIQIIDERPVVRDFREAPVAPKGIDLPPAPGAVPGAYGGGGAGAMGGPGDTIPDGMQVGGGGDPGYRTPVDRSPIPLDKADFNHAKTNIPAAGMAPKGFLPAAYNTGIHGKVMPPNYPQGLSATPGRGPRRAAPAAAAPATPVYSYSPSGNYGNGVGTAAGAGGASTSLVGKLLNKVK